MSTTRDDRVDVEESISRQGAHRAKPNPFLALLPFLAVGAVVLSVVALAWTLFGQGASRVATGTGASGSGASVGVIPSPAASGAATSSAASSASAGGSVSAAASVGSSAQPSASGLPAAGDVDKSIRLDYFNGTTTPVVPGQARKAEVQLRAAGWTNTGAIATWAGPAVQQNTIFYSDPAQLATARAVVKALGGGTVKLNTTYASAAALGVVVGDNFQP